MLFFNQINCWILSTPRTGGNFLSILLNETNLFDCQNRKHAFDEWFSFNTIEIASSDIIPTKKWFTIYPNCLNLHYETYYNFFESNKIQLESILPSNNFIVLKRKDFLNQVASCYVGAMTETWRLYCDGQKDYMKKNVNIDDFKIIQCYHKMLINKYAWNDIKGSNVINIWYEDLCNNPKSTLTTILDFLGLSCSNIDEVISRCNNKFIRTYRKETKIVRDRLEILSKNNFKIPNFI